MVCSYKMNSITIIFMYIRDWLNIWVDRSNLNGRLPPGLHALSCSHCRETLTQDRQVCQWLYRYQKEVSNCSVRFVKTGGLVHTIHMPYDQFCSVKNGSYQNDICHVSQRNAHYFNLFTLFITQRKEVRFQVATALSR